MDIRSFLADTNILSQTIKARPDPDVIEWLRRGPKLIVSHPAIFEIEWGAWKLRRTDPERAGRIFQYLDELIDKAGSDIPPSTTFVTRLQARMAEVPELTNLGSPRYGKRRRPPGQDVAIAAYAIAYHLPIATLDTGDFAVINKYFPLPGVFDPSTRRWTIMWSPSKRLRRHEKAKTAMDEVAPSDKRRYASIY